MSPTTSQPGDEQASARIIAGLANGVVRAKLEQAVDGFYASALHRIDLRQLNYCRKISIEHGWSDLEGLINEVILSCAIGNIEARERQVRKREEREARLRDYLALGSNISRVEPDLCAAETEVDTFSGRIDLRAYNAAFLKPVYLELKTDYDTPDEHIHQVKGYLNDHRDGRIICIVPFVHPKVFSYFEDDVILGRLSFYEARRSGEDYAFRRVTRDEKTKEVEEYRAMAAGRRAEARDTRGPKALRFRLAKGVCEEKNTSKYGKGTRRRNRAIEPAANVAAVNQSFNRQLECTVLPETAGILCKVSWISGFNDHGKYFVDGQFSLDRYGKSLNLHRLPPIPDESEIKELRLLQERYLRILKRRWEFEVPEINEDVLEQRLGRLAIKKNIRKWLSEICQGLAVTMKNLHELPDVARLICSSAHKQDRKLLDTTIHNFYRDRSGLQESEEVMEVFIRERPPWASGITEEWKRLVQYFAVVQKETNAFRELLLSTANLMKKRSVTLDSIHKTFGDLYFELDHCRADRIRQLDLTGMVDFTIAVNPTADDFMREPYRAMAMMRLTMEMRECYYREMLEAAHRARKLVVQTENKVADRPAVAAADHQEPDRLPSIIASALGSPGTLTDGMKKRLQYFIEDTRNVPRPRMEMAAVGIRGSGFKKFMKRREMALDEVEFYAFVDDIELTVKQGVELAPQDVDRIYKNVKRLLPAQ